MKRKLGTFLLGLGTVLVCAALFLLIYNQTEDRAAGKKAEEILKEIQAANKDAEIEPENLMSEKKIVVEGDDYIGYLSIPSLKIELPVMADWSYEKLKTAPCRQKGSISTKNMVIAAHNYASHFGNIDKLSSGDVVMFTDLNEVTTVYNVVNTEILLPHQVKEMYSDEWDLTLYTCTYSGQERITVRCKAGLETFK